jgi:single-strand DNA-binding protein
MNNCNFVGRVGKEPDIKLGASGNSQARLSIAYSEKHTNKQTGEKEEKTTWIPLKAFGRTAEIIQQFVHKGDQIAITAKYDSYSWTDNNGETKYSHDFVIQNMQMLGGIKNNGQQQPVQPQQPQHRPQQPQQGYAPQQQYQAPMNQQQRPQQPPPQYAPNDFQDSDVPF